MPSYSKYQHCVTYVAKQGNKSNKIKSSYAVTNVPQDYADFDIF